MRPSRTITRILAVVGAAFMSGCYSYVPVERPSPGSIVRIQVPVRTAVDNRNREPEKGCYRPIRTASLLERIDDTAKLPHPR